MFETSVNDRKLELTLNEETPILTEIRRSLGDSLTKVFLNYSSKTTKELVHLAPFLNIWQEASSSEIISMKDTIENPNLAYTKTKAEIHQFILELGNELVEKFRTEAEETQRQAMEAQLQNELCIYEAKHREEIKLCEEELHMKYQDYIKDLQCELEQRFQTEQKAAILNCNKKIQKAVVQERLNLSRQMLRKMRFEVSSIIRSLYDEFQQSFHSQRLNIISDFNEIMRNEHKKLNKTLKEFEVNKIKDLCVQRRELEVQNVTNMMNILCLERLKNRAQIHAMHTYFEKEITKLCHVNNQLHKIMTELKEKIKESANKEKLLKEELVNVFREFRKFLNFVLHCETLTDHADFLLPLDKTKGL